MIGMSTGDSLPTDLASAYAMILAQRAALLEAQTEAQHRALLIEKLKFNRQVAARGFGQSSERGAILDQLELQLADLEENAAEARTCSRPSTSMPTRPPSQCWPRGKTRTGRLWTYVRDDRPFGGPDPLTPTCRRIASP